MLLTTVAYTQNCFELESSIKSGYVDGKPMSFAAVAFGTFSMYLPKDVASKTLREWIINITNGNTDIQYNGTVITDMMLVTDAFHYRRRYISTRINVTDPYGFVDELKQFLFCNNL